MRLAVSNKMKATNVNPARVRLYPEFRWFTDFKADPIWKAWVEKLMSAPDSTIEPITVAKFEGDTLFLLDGRKRRLAAMEAGIQTIPVRVIQYGEDMTLWHVYVDMIKLHPNVAPIDLINWMDAAYPFMPFEENYPPNGFPFSYHDAVAFVKKCGIRKMQGIAKMPPKEQIDTIKTILKGQR